MNDLTVIQASQGLCRNAETLASHSPTFNVDGLLCSYLESQGIAEKGVVIGYDGRHNSKDFAVRVRCASDFSPESIPAWHVAGVDCSRLHPPRRARVHVRRDDAHSLCSVRRQAVWCGLASARRVHQSVCRPIAVVHGRAGCAAGVMVTASHNPKQDNGYKARCRFTENVHCAMRIRASGWRLCRVQVYWSNGSQIIPPHDVGISSHIAAHQAMLARTASR